jgi:hypothetical protein
MKLRKLVAICAISVSVSASAQTPLNKAYAITSVNKGAIEWTEVRLIDLNTGNVIHNVFENTNGQYNVFNGRTSKEIKLTRQTDSSADNNKRPFAGLSAACAYDKKLNRLYYAPLFINQLRYIDMNTPVPGVYLFEDEPFSNASDLDVEANQITRMVISADGNGYALNNDGSHLVRFTTAEKPVITDLGGLSNAAENGDVSVTDPNISWGGDMVADASGNLYLISAHNHVFKINVLTRVASFIDKIEGLPEGFTTNGAVVDEDGFLVLSSANSITSYYKVNPSDWKAVIIPSNGEVFNTSDLANENFLFGTKLVSSDITTQQERIGVYPNPVKSNVFRVTFTNKPAGKYNVQLVDIAGRMVSDRSVNVFNSGQVSEVRIDPSLSRGMYMVKVLNNNSKEIFIRKIIVE